MMKILVKALRDDEDFHMEVELLAGVGGIGRQIVHPRVQKPGLAIAGFLESMRPDRVQVLGKTELAYLHSLSEDEQSRSIAAVLAQDIACIVLTSGLHPPVDMVELANREDVPLFRTELASSLIINRIHAFLDEHLSPEVSVHGVLIDVFGVGVLLTGPSGIGKSESALDLVLRGHRMVADDVVLIKRINDRLVGSGSTLTRHHMEVRGLGIINVKDLFGAASVREHKHIEMVVELTEWHTDGKYDRTGLSEDRELILERDVPKVVLPVRPGRNLASIVEVASRNHLLKVQGHHSALEFQASIERRLEATEHVGESE